MNYYGESAIITGATSGIGAAFAQALAQRGVTLLLSGRRESLLRAHREELLISGAPSVDIITGDLSDPDIIARLEREISERRCAILINNAGFGYYSTIAEARIETLESMLTVQARVPLRLCTAALAGMTTRKNGLIINVGSLAGRVAVPGSAVYVSTKIYLERLSESMAIEAAPHGVVVQALTPGYVRTDFHREIENYQEKRRNRGLIRWMNADAVVERSIRAADRAAHRLSRPRCSIPRRRDVIVIPGLANRLLAAIEPFVPRTLLYKAASSQALM